MCPALRSLLYIHQLIYSSKQPFKVGTALNPVLYMKTRMLRNSVPFPESQLGGRRTGIILVTCDQRISLLETSFGFPYCLCDKVQTLQQGTRVFSGSGHFPPFLLHLSLDTLSSNQSEFCTVSPKCCALFYLSLHLLGCPPSHHPLPKSLILENSYSAFLVPLRWTSPFSAFPSTLCRLGLYRINHMVL